MPKHTFRVRNHGHTNCMSALTHTLNLQYMYSNAKSSIHNLTAPSIKTDKSMSLSELDAKFLKLHLLAALFGPYRELHWT